MTTNLRIPPARRILTLARSLNGDEADNGLLQLANDWARAGRSVTIMAGQIDRCVALRLAPNVDIVELGSRWGHSALVTRQLVRTLDADILFCPDNRSFAMARTIRKLLGKGCPLVVAGLPGELPANHACGLPLPARRWQRRWWQACIDHFVATTPEIRAEAIDAMGIAARRTSLIPASPATACPESARASSGSFHLALFDALIAEQVIIGLTDLRNPTPQCHGADRH